MQPISFLLQSFTVLRRISDCFFLFCHDLVVSEQVEIDRPMIGTDLGCICDVRMHSYNTRIAEMIARYLIISFKLTKNTSFNRKVNSIYTFSRYINITLCNIYTSRAARRSKSDTRSSFIRYDYFRGFILRSNQHASHISHNRDK